MSEEDENLEDKSLQEQFRDLPMKDLIGGPLKAAAKEQIETAQETLDFIERISEDQPQTKFSFTGAKGEISSDIKMNVPILAVVPVPSLKDDNSTFEMEVVSDKEDIEAGDNKAEEGTDESVSPNFGFKVSVSSYVESPPSKGKETESKYRMDDSASQQQAEGLSKVTELMSKALKKEK